MAIAKPMMLLVRHGVDERNSAVVLRMVPGKITETQLLAHYSNFN